MATQLAEPEPIDTGQDIEGQAGDRDYEGEARAHGWVPADEFKGDKSRCVDAKTFVERADEVMPLLRKQNKEFKGKIDFLERQIKKVMKSEQGAYEQALADVKVKMENAVVTGNMAAYKALDEQADGLRKGMVADTPTHSYTEADINQAFDAWADDNEWYHLGGLPSATDAERRQRAYFDRMAASNGDKAQGMAPADFIAHIGELVEAKYPATTALRPKATESVAGVTRTAATRSVHSGANLPSHAKETAERYIRIKVPGYAGKTKAEAYELFAKDWDWS